MGEIIRMEERYRNIKAKVTQILGKINGCLVMTLNFKDYNFIKCARDLPLKTDISFSSTGRSWAVFNY